MVSDKEVTRWVGDRLHDILGFSESNTAQFIVALAKRASGVDALVEQLADNDVPVNDNTRAFAGELLSKLGRGSARPAAAAPPGRTQADALAASASYSLMLSDDESSSAVSKPAASKISKSKAAAAATTATTKKAGKHKARHRHASDSSEDDTVVRAKRPRAAAEPETEEQAHQRQLDEDLAERNALVERMAERDKSKTKSAELGGLTPAQVQELATRGVVTKDGQLVSGEDKPLTIKEMRELSRQLYLPKRADKELRLLEAQLRDEEELFTAEGVALTEAERRRAEIGRQVRHNSSSNIYIYCVLLAWCWLQARLQYTLYSVA
jgi:hypothetical protein